MTSNSVWLVWVKYGDVWRQVGLIKNSESDACRSAMIWNEEGRYDTSIVRVDPPTDEEQEAPDDRA